MNSGEKGGNKKQTSHDINRIINDKLEHSKRVKISGLNGQNSIGVGLSSDCEINISGGAGDFLGAFNKGAIIILNGDCGDLVGDIMLKGGIIILGNCGARAGAGMQNGIIVVKGNSKYQTGIMMQGGTILIDGNIDGDLAPNQVQPLAQAPQTIALSRRRCDGVQCGAVETCAVVLQAEASFFLTEFHGQGGVTRTGMLLHVGQAFLRHSIECCQGRIGISAFVTIDLEVD